MPARDPLCSVRGCAQATDGVLTVPTAQGTFHVSACEDHGRRTTEGEWFYFTVTGSTYLLGKGAESTAPVHYDRFEP